MVCTGSMCTDVIRPSPVYLHPERLIPSHTLRRSIPKPGSDVNATLPPPCSRSFARPLRHASRSSKDPEPLTQRLPTDETIAVLIRNGRYVSATIGKDFPHSRERYTERCDRRLVLTAINARLAVPIERNALPIFVPVAGSYHVDGFALNHNALPHCRLPC